MGSQNTAPAPHRAGRVGPTTTSTSDGHRAPCTTTSQRTSHATGQEDMQQDRLPSHHHSDAMHNTCTRGRPSTRHNNRTRIRQGLPSPAHSMGAEGSSRHRHMLALPQAHHNRSTVPLRPRRPRPQHHSWTRAPALQPQRGRQSLPPVRLDQVGGTPKPTPMRQTAGEVSGWCANRSTSMERRKEALGWALRGI
ncbi:MAG: hypothetical protein JWL94_2362 [Microbacteriaceae bacterium]|jgi:hypothetical protein|nr:hypothetical protein [Microbacteriaceae bacterium]